MGQPRTLAPLLRASPLCMYTLSTTNLNQQINAYVSNGNVNDARRLFDKFPHSTNTVSWNCLIKGYAKIRHFSEAQKLFDQMPQRDVVSYNTMFSLFRDSKTPQSSHRFFLEMRASGPLPDELSFAVLTSAFSNTEFDVLIPQLHGLVICLGLDLNVYLGSSLMRGYISLGDRYRYRDAFVRVFNEILVKEVVPCNVLILGYMELGLISEAKRAFDMMPKRNAFSWSIMINGYMKNRMVSEARVVFDRLSEKDVVSWTAMMRGCVRCKKYVECLVMFVSMMSSWTRPNHYTFSTIIDACAGCSSLVIGNQLHACMLKFGIPIDVIVATSLVDMYGKCGDIDAAFRVFESMSTKNSVSWNAIIGGYARHGIASRALEEFRRMVKSGVVPDEISFINVLSACAHGGMVEEGEEIFKSMQVKYGMEATVEHYSCMVDLYGKAGELRKAEELIKTMPFEADVVVWGALLGGCGLHSCLEIGENAANGICKVEKDHPAVYSMLSKIYGESGARSGVIQLDKMIENRSPKKQKAGSWIESNPSVII